MKTSKTNAFTLIELLVVISIIAILAGIALPVFGEVKIRGDQTKALSNAKQIATACKLFALDYNGTFPHYTDLAAKTEASSSSKSNDVLQTLVPDYLPNKSIFAIPKSKYCKNAGSSTATSTANASILGAAENEWAYVNGMTDTSNPSWVLLADGPAEGGTAYVTDDTVPGGIWKGKKAVTVRADMSGNVETLTRTGHFIKRNPDEADATAKDALVAGKTDTPPWWDGTSVYLLLPTPPAS